jgi:trypsin
MRVTVPIIARATCNTMYKAVPDYGTTPINNNMICAGYAAGGRDSCQGDSGGPLVDSSNTLICVVSWGRNCAAPNFPGVYARTGNYISWINSQA